MRNLENATFNKVNDVIGKFPVKGREKEIAKGFLKQLEHELKFHCPVRELINTYVAKHKTFVYPEEIDGMQKTGGEMAVIKGLINEEEHGIEAVLLAPEFQVYPLTRSEKHEVNHYRRLKRAHNKNGLQGVVDYLIILANRFRLPKENTLEYKALTPEKVEEYARVTTYFQALIIAVANGCLPIRNAN